MKAPQFIFLLLMVVDFGVALALYGEPGKKPRAWSSLFRIFVVALLLTWGGFFETAVR